MKTNKIIILITLSMGLLLSAATQAATSGFYANPFIGGAFMPNVRYSMDTSNDSYIKFDKINDLGYNAGLALGYQFDNNVRLEVAASYIKNTSDRLKLRYYSDSDDYYHLSYYPHTMPGSSGYTEVIPVMINGYYDFAQPYSSSMTPYVGFGLGMARWTDYLKYGDTDYHYNPISGTEIKVDANVLAAQVAFGVKFQVNNQLAVNLNYTGIGIPTTTLTGKDKAGNRGEIKESYFNNLVNVGLIYSFVQ